MRCLRLVPWLLSLPVLACTPTGDGRPNAGGQGSGTTDGGLLDAGPVDAGLVDAGVFDAGLVDAGLVDAGAGEDGGAHVDAGPTEVCGQTFQPAPFPGCPTAVAFVGDASWTVPVEIPAGALYCASFEESRALEDEPAHKGQLYFAPGDFVLPAVAGSYEVSLPLCFELPGDATPALAGPGALEVDVNTYDGRTFHRWSLRQPLDDGGAPFELLFEIQLETTAASPALRLDGQYQRTFVPPGADVLSTFLMLCEGASCDTASSRRYFSPCAFDVVPPVVHTVAFAGGEVELELRIGDPVISTEPASFSRASGTLDGVPFVVEDYWRLVYNPEHHHFRRDFLVLFEAPIGEAAGLRVVDVDPHAPVPARVHTVGCDLQPIEERAVTSETVKLP